MAQGVGVQRLVKRAMDHVRFGPGTGKVFGGRPWSVHVEWIGGTRILSLHHYGTKMLEWETLSGDDVKILGWWAGWGSVSDQTGVNAALRTLGSNKRYSRDRRGGGPRVNPYRVSASVGRGLNVITPPVY